MTDRAFFFGCLRVECGRWCGWKSSAFDKLRKRILCAPRPTVGLTLSLSKGEGGRSKPINT
jgi:hypothetical protein